ncbi:helix-turn-helix domain-containing protein [Amycolatopsis sp. WQ 127309]|uniref:helix-turn-helix domain-containing protein n=1 Tax=Amycolatopsis sp. WQ 127309 TaxID=2932773 RepID=UPI001FF25D00|nr:helix-turn-helix transcriptional regulator [Amycolatopsis sp. WQ 127309]UOZ09859.1 helix-turn-helix domain-containing protein [Amycolatopsis sp. WQ 127309]
MAQERTFAERLAALIEAARLDGQAPHSYREISAAVERAGGPAMSPAYLQQLATGKRVNPKIHYVEALARLFGVPVTYFFDAEATGPAPTGEAQLMAMRAQELSPQGRRQVMDLLDLVERYERAERDGRNPEDAPR